MQALDVVATLLVGLGLVGLLVPGLPDTPLIFLGALVADYARGWEALGWGWLGLLFFLTLLSLAGEWWLSNTSAKRGGASWRALAAGALLGLIGLFLLPPFGFLIGSLVGVIGTELLTERDARRALRAGGGWLTGWLLSLLMQGTIAILMVGLLLWQLRY